MLGERVERVVMCLYLEPVWIYATSSRNIIQVKTYPGGAEVGAEVATPGPSSTSAASGTAANGVYVARKADDRFDPHVDELGEYSPSTPCGEAVAIYGSLDPEI